MYSHLSLTVPVSSFFPLVVISSRVIPLNPGLARPGYRLDIELLGPVNHSDHTRWKKQIYNQDRT